MSGEKMQSRQTKIINGETYLPCSQCGQFKKLDEFGLYKGGKLGRKSWCKSCANKYRKDHHKENRKAVDKYIRNNRELCIKRTRQWRLNNPEKLKKACHNWYSRTKNKITECLLGRVRQSLNGKVERKKVWEILGYTYEEFVKHVEKLFQPGMTWDNHGEWEIDHIIPVAFFQFKSHKDVEFKMCWRLENIQPLWKHQNKQKGNKILVA